MKNSTWILCTALDLVATNVPYFIFLVKYFSEVVNFLPSNEHEIVPSSTIMVMLLVWFKKEGWGDRVYQKYPIHGRYLWKICCIYIVGRNRSYLCFLFAAFCASISCLIARRFFVFFEREVFLFSIPVARFAILYSFYTGKSLKLST